MNRRILPLLSVALISYSFSQDDIRIVPYQEDININTSDGTQILLHHRYVTENLERLVLISDNADVSLVTRHMVSKFGIGFSRFEGIEFKDERTVEINDSTQVTYSLELKFSPTLDIAFQDSVSVPAYDFYSLTARKEILVNGDRTFFLVIHDGGIGRTNVEGVGRRKPVDGFVDRALLFKDGKWIHIEFNDVSERPAFVKTQRLYIETADIVIGKY